MVYRFDDGKHKLAIAWIKTKFNSKIRGMGKCNEFKWKVIVGGETINGKRKLNYVLNE